MLTTENLEKIILLVWSYGVWKHGLELPHCFPESLSKLSPPEDIDQEVGGGVDREGEVSQPGHSQDDGGGVLPTLRWSPGIK